ncbi:hypothetical protein LCGC14_1078660 [marine sediment metagenome]|uniref:Uncharacterized protein n=1 Tax=marine sediment metagenome TaxID=412755 RepID=A0A0F9MG33_9ZZZZ
MDLEEKVFIKADDTYIYERDGDTVYRRKFMDYDNRETISTEKVWDDVAKFMKTGREESEQKQKRIWEQTKKLSAESLKIQQEEFKQWERDEFYTSLIYGEKNA